MRFIIIILFIAVSNVTGCASAPVPEQVRSPDGCWMHIIHNDVARNLLSICIDGKIAKAFVFYANVDEIPPTICRYIGAAGYLSPDQIQVSMKSGPCENGRIAGGMEYECSFQGNDTLDCLETSQSGNNVSRMQFRRDHDRSYLNELGHKLASSYPNLGRAHVLLNEEKWEAAHDEFEPLAYAGNLFAIYGLGYVEYYRDNFDASRTWMYYAATMGHSPAIEYLGDLAPHDIHVGRQLQHRLSKCDLLLDSVSVSRDWRALHLRIENKIADRSLLFVTTAADVYRSEEVFLHGLEMLQEIDIPVDSYINFSVLVSGGDADQLQLHFSCDGKADVVIIPLNDERIKAEEKSMIELHEAIERKSK